MKERKYNIWSLLSIIVMGLFLTLLQDTINIIGAIGMCLVVIPSVIELLNTKNQ